MGSDASATYLDEAGETRGEGTTCRRGLVDSTHDRRAVDPAGAPDPAAGARGGGGAPARAGRPRRRRAARGPVDARSRRSWSTGAGRWSCSAPAGASRRSTSSRPRCCARRGAGPTVIVSPLLALMRNQIAAAERAGHPRGDHQLRPTSRSGSRSTTRSRAGEVDVLLVSPGAAQQPGFRDEVLPRLAADHRPARGRRGALHLRLGPRLPPRLPPDPHPAGRPARRHPGAGHHRHRQRPGHRRRRRAARRAADGQRRSRGRRARAARLPRPGVPAPRRGPAAHAPSSGWPGWPTTSPSSPARASSTASPWRPPRRSPTTCARAGHDVAAYSGQTDPTERHALEEDLVAGRVKALVATSRSGHGLRRHPRLRGQPGRARSRRSPTTSRSAAPAAAPTRRHGGAAAGAGGPRHLGLLRLAGLPARGAGPRHPGGAGRGGPAAEHRRAGDPRRAGPHPAGDDAQGARRRRRRPPGAGRLGRPPAATWVYDAERYRRVAEAREREQQAMLDYLDTDRVPDVVPARPARRPGGAPTAGGATTAAGSTCRARACPRRPSPRPAQRLSRPGVVVEPRKLWPTGAGQPRRRPARARSPRAPAQGRAVARLTDLGYGQALRDLFRAGHPRRAGPGAAGAGRARGARRLAACGRRRSSWSSRRPGPLLVRDLADGLSRHLRVPVVGAFAIVDPVGPARAGRDQLRAAGRRRAPSAAAGSWSRAASTGRSVLLVDDRVVTGWTPHPRRGGPARGGCRGGFPSGARRRVVTSAPRIGATVVP